MSVDHEWTKHPVCPACGHEFTDAWEWGLEDGGVVEQECDCGAKFTATMYEMVRFSTELIASKEAPCDKS